MNLCDRLLLLQEKDGVATHLAGTRVSCFGRSLPKPNLAGTDRGPEVNSCTVGASTTGKLISPTNSKHLACHFGSELFLVAILFFGYHFLVKWLQTAKIYLHAKFRTSSLKIKIVMSSIRKGKQNV